MSRLNIRDLTGANPNDMGLGDTERVYHVGCTTKRDATIHRIAPGWVLHCFKCGESGFHHARVSPTSIASIPTRVVKGKGYAPTVVKVDLAAAGHADALYKLGILPWFSYDYDLKIDTKDQRVYFPVSRTYRTETGDIVVERAGMAGKTYQDAKPKWYVVEDQHVRDAALISIAQRAGTGMIPRAVVLTEDPISALKISAADDSVVGVAMLGLQIPPALIEMLVHMCSGWTVAVWPDGDAPGVLRGTKLYEQLKFIIPDAFFIVAPGQDPKDLSLAELREYLDTIPEKASA